MNWIWYLKIPFLFIVWTLNQLQGLSKSEKHGSLLCDVVNIALRVTSSILASLAESQWWIAERYSRKNTDLHLQTLSVQIDWNPHIVFTCFSWFSRNWPLLPDLNSALDVCLCCAGHCQVPPQTFPVVWDRDGCLGLVLGGKWEGSAELSESCPDVSGCIYEPIGSWWMDDWIGWFCVHIHDACEFHPSLKISHLETWMRGLRSRERVAVPPNRQYEGCKHNFEVPWCD